jgi:hypothetical protein
MRSLRRLADSEMTNRRCPATQFADATNQTGTWTYCGLRRQAGAYDSNTKSWKKTAKRTTSKQYDELSHPVTEELTALRAIVDAASYGSGEEYFQALVRTLARVVDTRWAYIAQFASPETHTKPRTIASWDRDHFTENFERASHVGGARPATARPECPDR